MSISSYVRLVGAWMDEERHRPLKVFLCHASGDKPAVRALYQRLIRDGVDAWLDREKLLPGQDWRVEIPKAVRESDVVVICLSNRSTTKEGYVQKEIKFALDIASEKPEGTIFLIPARLEECSVPAQLSLWQWVDLFEEDGYERLMRSLRVRADKLGLRTGETIFTDQELEQRVDQLYTEGLAALWVEDWDKAYHRFQAILREKPDHVQAVAKLEQTKRQKHLHALYTQALDAQRNEDWQQMVDVLEKLTGEVSNYKDALRLLNTARKKNQLSHLYDEARTLHRARQWQAVLKVFAEIAAIDPNYPDPDELLSSAEREVAELRRLAELNNLYAQAVREMDAGEFYEARRLLEQVQNSQTGFLETERLLRKVENEIGRIEELNRRNVYVSTLYEQAHGLVRSKKWRKALDKIEEIQQVDPEFDDKDRLFEKIRKELAREEDIVQRQNRSAALYAEAVRLFKEEKYQDALDTWKEVRTIDPNYPDRQRIQRMAKKKLSDINRSADQIHDRFWKRRPFLSILSVTAIVGLIALLTVSQSAIPFFSGLINPSSTPRSEFPTPTPRREFPIQIRILTTSDWTKVELTRGGRLKNIRKKSSSPEASLAEFDGVVFVLQQPVARANGVNSVEMIMEAVLFNTSPSGLLVFLGERGCIGRTDIELFNAIAEPTQVRNFTWGDSCYGDGSPRTFVVPLTLFTE
jgi:outer membrane protein assembly factor BamD (BamD/ComL family)